jgi:chromosome segregation ATPase
MISTAPTGTDGADGSNATDAASIRAQVEKEQALKDAQRRVRALEEEVSRVKGEKTAVEGERDAAGMYLNSDPQPELARRGHRKLNEKVQSTNQLRTQLSTLQSTHHKSASELSVLQTRIEVHQLQATRGWLRTARSELIGRLSSEKRRSWLKRLTGCKSGPLGQTVSFLIPAPSISLISRADRSRGAIYPSSAKGRDGPKDCSSRCRVV